MIRGILDGSLTLCDIDGVTDDTTAIQNFINQYWGCKILYADAGTYRLTNTVTIPTGSIVVGEIWTTFIGK